MNILLIAKAYPPETGGIETYSEQVAMAYGRDGHATTVVTAFAGPRGRTVRGNVVIHNVGAGAAGAGLRADASGALVAARRGVRLRARDLVAGRAAGDAAARPPAAGGDGARPRGLCRATTVPAAHAPGAAAAPG